MNVSHIKHNTTITKSIDFKMIYYLSFKDQLEISRNSKKNIGTLIIDRFGGWDKN